MPEMRRSPAADGLARPAPRRMSAAVLLHGLGLDARLDRPDGILPDASAADGWDILTEVREAGGSEWRGSVSARAKPDGVKRRPSSAYAASSMASALVTRRR